jgi:hypothetical protein
MVAAVCFAISLYFVWRSFYGMRIVAQSAAAPSKAAVTPAE